MRQTLFLGNSWPWRAGIAHRFQRLPIAVLRATLGYPPTKGLAMDQATKDLVRFRAQKSEACFGVVYREFAPKLNGYLLRRRISPAVAEDIMQEIFVAIWHKIDQFDPKRGPASAWIYQITRHKMIDYLRREPMPMSVTPEIADSTADAASHHEFLSEVAALRRALTSLNPDQRQMVEQAFLAERDHNDLARSYDLPLGTVKSRIRLGLEKLRYELRLRQL